MYSNKITSLNNIIILTDIRLEMPSSDVAKDW